MTEITVVITAYKLEKMLPACLGELLDGTFQDFDVLIVDDCSPDGTAEVIQQYEAAYPDRIRGLYLPQNLGSPAKTRNAALNSGSILGRYVIFLDGDDSTEPDFLEKLHTKAQETGADITVCAYDRVDLESGHVLCKEMQGFPPFLRLQEQADTLPYVNASLWNKLIRTSIIGDTRVPDFKVGEDLCFLYRLYAKCSSLAFLDDILLHYHVRSNSVISNTQLETIHALAEELENQLRSAKDPQFRKPLELAAFIHVGISMPLRAKDNPAIDLKEHLAWTREYLKRNGLLKPTGYLTLSSLALHGIKGLGIWGCRILHRLNCFPLFLGVYNFVRKTLHIDIKF